LIESCTFTNNTAAIEGGAFNGLDDRSIFINSILWDNSPDEIYLEEGATTELTYSNIMGGWTGIGNINQDPLFVDPVNGDFSLQPSSPCIDTGDPESPVPWGGGYRIDMGALEYFKGFNIIDDLNSGMNLHIK
jgi:hypothetical protein